MTASLVIRQIKKLPARERAKVNRYIYANHVPNATTRKVIAEANAGRGLVQCRNAEDLMASLKS